MLYCGFAEREITPEVGMGMPGYFHDRTNEGAVDPLYAKAVVFENGDNMCALIVLDAIQIERSDVFDIRYKASRLTPVEADNIFVWATHTHTGGPVDGAMSSKRNKKYLNNLSDQAAEAVREAYGVRRPAKIGSTAGNVDGIVFIRRFIMESGGAEMNPDPDAPGIIGEEGEPDTTFTLARVEDAETGEIMGFISSLGLHLDTFGASTASADYPGVLAKLIREKYGENVKSVFFTGPCGNTNHLNVRDKSTYNGKVMRFTIGNKLFDTVTALNEKIVCTDGDISIKSRRYLEKLRGVTPEQVEWAKDVLEGRENNLFEERFRMDIFAKPLIDIDKRIEQTVEMEVAAVKVGDLTVICWPGEVFVEFGMDIRKEFPGENIIIGELGGGSVVCYICTRRGHENGGYEPMAASALCLEPDGGYNMVSETLKMLKK